MSALLKIVKELFTNSWNGFIAMYNIANSASKPVLIITFFVLFVGNIFSLTTY